MKIFIIVVVALASLLLVLSFGAAGGERRARFVNSMNALKEAHIELKKTEGFTNYFRDMSVYSYTNQLAVNGSNYECEYAVETEEFKERGFLTITTNEVFLWVDKKHGVVPLLMPPTFPPGF